jgi:hypothetical protein
MTDHVTRTLKEWISPAEEATIELGRRLGRACRGGEIIESPPRYVPSSRQRMLPGRARFQKLAMRNARAGDDPSPLPDGDAK